MNNAGKPFAAEFGGAMAAYVVVLATSMALIGRFPDSGWRFAAALAPVVPLCLAMRAILRFVGRVDELARKIHLESFAVAAGVTAIASFGYGMLQIVGAPPINGVWVLPFVVFVWGLASAAAARRYS